MFADLVDKILDNSDLYDDSELEELLRRAKLLLNETDLVIIR